MRKMEQANDALFQVFENEADAKKSHDDQVVQGRQVRLLKVSRANGQVIPASGDPESRIREIGTRFVVYSEG
jgi:hypothetical protein